jgi:hypothetical protein
LSNGSVVINQQEQTIGATSGELTVRALRVLTHDTVTGQPLADVALGTAIARIDCEGGSSPGLNWMSGGGWFNGAGGERVTFGFVAGPSGQATRGHLTLKDHSANQTTVHATVITQMTECVGAGETRFEAKDQNEIFYTVNVTDTGEPSPPVTETFAIAGGYENGGPLQGGNNQAHGYSCM